jgi:hypothetical protein
MVLALPKVRALLLPLLAAAGLVGCRVSADFDDATPPSLELYYSIDGAAATLLPAGGATITLEGSQLQLLAMAKDSGGIKRVQVSAEGEVTCQRGGATGVKYKNTISEKENNDADSSVEDGDSVYKSLGSSLKLRFCSGEDVALKGTITVQALARNFAGLTTTSDVLTVHAD